MKYLFLKDKLDYDGSQLRSLYAYLNHDLLGDSMLAFEGRCNVTLDHMVDGEDRKALAKIQGDHMLHFLIEIFDRELFSAVALQRLFASLVIDALRSLSPTAQDLNRDGDDIYLGSKKLSISIATASPVGRNIHFAVNVSNAGTPVETLSLQDLGVDPRQLADHMGRVFVKEYTDIRHATQKVFWVK